MLQQKKLIEVYKERCRIRNIKSESRTNNSNQGG